VIGLSVPLNVESYLNVARDCTLSLHKGDYIKSYQVLAYLKHLYKVLPSSKFDDYIYTFIKQAEDFLFQIVQVFPYPQLSWEATIYNKME
jgi:hypothetical protein